MGENPSPLGEDFSICDISICKTIERAPTPGRLRVKKPFLGYFL